MADTIKSLPVQVRIGIRDIFEAKGSAHGKALASLNSLVGVEFTVSVPWVDIYRDLKDKFMEDKDMLVKSVCGAIESFATRLESLIDTDEAFQETFLDQVPSLAKDIVVGICDGKHPKSLIARFRITLLLPSVNAAGFRNIEAEIGRDLPSLFSSEEAEPPKVSAAPIEEEDWDTISVTPATVAPQIHYKAPEPTQQTAVPLPTARSLERPDVLFKRLSPYVLVRGYDNEILIESSHAPTLELISDYFKEYLRKNMEDSRKTPYMKVELKASFLGTGTMYDSLAIGRFYENQKWVKLNISIVLAFIEGVCGYHLIPDSARGGEYMFKRLAPFI